jgi:hypothetical protein
MHRDDSTDAPAPDDGAEASEPQGVFGNLPQTRPGARSPRRGEARGGGARRATPSKPQPATSPPPPPRREAAAAAAEPGPAPGKPAEQGGGLEDVAWAGVAAAAEAATIGVRLATRALEAMRDAVDRR